MSSASAGSPNITRRPGLPRRNSSIHANSQDRQGEKRPEPELPPQAEPIPPLLSIVSSIFVPIDETVLDPAELPRDRIARLELMLKRIDTHADDVKRNLMWMFTRERDRVQQNAASAAAQAGAPREPAMRREELEMMLSNAKAPAVEGINYSVPRDDIYREQLRNWLEGDQDLAMDEISSAALRAANNISGYDGMIERIKMEYRQAIAKEVVAEARNGGAS